MKIHAEIWIAAQHLGKGGQVFRTEELRRFMREKFGDRRPGVSIHIGSYCVASTMANPGRYRYLTKVGPGQFRIYRPGDPVHPTKATAPTHPAIKDLPPEFHSLLSQVDVGSPTRAEAPRPAPRKDAPPAPIPETTEELGFTLRYAWRPVTSISGQPYQYPDPLGSGIAVECDGPAVYRWVILKEGSRDAERLYIGEAEILSRRVYGYLNPGPRQQTNIRLSDEFAKEIGAGNTVRLETLEFAPFEIGGVRISMEDLADRRVRRYLEALVTLTSSRSGQILLNA